MEVPKSYTKPPTGTSHTTWSTCIRFGSVAEDLKDLVDMTWSTCMSLSKTASTHKSPIIIIDSDEEDISEQNSINPVPSVVLAESALDSQVKGIAETRPLKQKLTERNADETETRKGVSTYASKQRK